MHIQTKDAALIRPGCLAMLEEEGPLSKEAINFLPASLQQ